MLDVVDKNITSPLAVISVTLVKSKMAQHTVFILVCQIKHFAFIAVGTASGYSKPT